MAKHQSKRRNILESLVAPDEEQRLELFLFQLQQRSTAEECSTFVDQVISEIDVNEKSYSIYNYKQLFAMGYTVEEIVDKTVALSSQAIVNYDSDSNDAMYWLEHRKNSKDYFLCAMYAGIILGHFSITPVLASEAADFLRGERSETEFTVVSGADILTVRHYLYISSVAVQEMLRNSAISLHLIRQGYRMLNNHLASNPYACGYFAEAYSPAGERLCEFFSMHNINGSFFVNTKNCISEVSTDYVNPESSPPKEKTND